MSDQHDMTDRPGNTPAGSRVYAVPEHLRHLTSRQNARVKAVAKLSSRRERESTGTHLVEGPNAVLAAFEAGSVVTVFVLDEAASQFDLAAWSASVEVVLVTREVLAKMSDATTPQPVMAVARQTYAALADLVGTGVLVVLESPNDPGNLGTVIRTADAAGCAGVVLVGGGVDQHHPKVVRAAAGSLAHVEVAQADDMDEVAAACRAAGQQLVGLAMEGTSDVFDLERSTGPVALVFGTESHGLSDAAVKICDHLAGIPQYGRAESLNLGVAVGITIYAAIRGQRTGRPSS